MLRPKSTSSMRGIAVASDLRLGSNPAATVVASITQTRQALLLFVSGLPHNSNFWDPHTPLAKNKRPGLVFVLDVATDAAGLSPGRTSLAIVTPLEEVGLEFCVKHDTLLAPSLFSTPPSPKWNLLSGSDVGRRWERYRIDRCWHRAATTSSKISSRGELFDLSPASQCKVILSGASLAPGFPAESETGTPWVAGARPAHQLTTSPSDQV